MANSLHLQVRDAIAAALAPVAAGNVKKGRTWPMPASDKEMVKVFLDLSNKSKFTLAGQPDDWSTRVRCEFHARGTAAGTGEELADALLTEGYALVMADPTLGGLGILDLQAVAMAWSIDDADTSIGVAQVVFQVMHRTPSTTIAA